uniref:Uncharacterized protein n=1 Tax=Schistosoma mansoni TaxID=6183 RepID=A0AA82N8E3_SCHMA
MFSQPYLVICNNANSGQQRVNALEKDEEALRDLNEQNNE